MVMDTLYLDVIVCICQKQKFHVLAIYQGPLNEGGKKHRLSHSHSTHKRLCGTV